MATTLRNYIGGEWIAPGNVEYLELTNPATGETLGKVPMSGARAVAEAVAAAQTAFLKWRTVPPVVRARHLFKLKYLMEEHFDEIATTVTREHGKTLDEARGSVRRGIENVEHACGIPALMMGKTLEDVASGIDCEYVRQPLGVFAAITPFNFPAMVPCWFWPYAIATGNTFILKPSEQVPFSSTRILELTQEAGIPPGVLNMVHGGKDAVNALLAHPGIAGISFVGSSPVAKYVYQEGAKHGKRVQALGGAKNHVNRCSAAPANAASREASSLRQARRTSRSATSSSAPRRICGLATASTPVSRWGPSSRLGTRRRCSPTSRRGARTARRSYSTAARPRSRSIRAATLSAPPSSTACSPT